MVIKWPIIPIIDQGPISRLWLWQPERIWNAECSKSKRTEIKEKKPKMGKKRSKFWLMRIHQIKIFYTFVLNRGEIYLFSNKIAFSAKLMYQSNRSFNIPPPNPNPNPNPPPPPGNLPGIWIFGKFLFKFPPPRAKKLFKCSIIGPFQVIKCPHPWEKLPDYLIIQHKESQVSLTHAWKEVGWEAFSCWTKYSKCFASNIMKS